MNVLASQYTHSTFEKAVSGTKLRLIEQGLTMLMERGYEGTHIGDVLEACKVPKGSFYHYFPSKEQFCLAILNHYAQNKASSYEAFFQDESLTPLNRIRKSLIHGMKCLAEQEFKTGCLIGTLGQEIGSQSEELRARLDTMLNHWRCWHLDCFEAAILSGELSGSINRENLMESYLMAIQGAILEAKIVKSNRPFKVVHWLFFEQLGTPKSPLSPEDEVFLQSL